MASILGTGTLWIRVPETIKVNITGKLPDNVMAKDIILKLIGDLGADGATYKALEFAGDTVENMSVASRMSMSNMAIEAGAKCALFTPDEKTAKYCEIELTGGAESERAPKSPAEPAFRWSAATCGNWAKIQKHLMKWWL